MQYSIVNYSEVNSIFDFRIDAEYWHPKYLRVGRYLSSKGVPIKPYLNKIRCGPFGTTIKCETYLEDGVIVARPFNINNYQFELNNLAYISHEDCKNKGLELYKDGDILFSRVGDVKVGIISDTDKAITISPNIIAISVKKELLNPYYCCVFFNSKFGLPQIQRGLKVVAQPTISTELIRQLVIIILSSEFQNKVQDIFLHSLEIKKESESFYTQAQTLLLSELGLANWQPKYQLTFVKNYSDTEQAERIDADYFQPKYEEIDKVLIKLNGKPIGSYEFLDITTGQYCANYVASNEGLPYLRGTDLAVGSIAMESLFYIKLEEQIQSKQAQEGDVVVTRVGTIGLSARIPEECDGGTISDNLIRVRILDKSKIDSYYLSCFLGSEIGKSLMLRNARGSVQQRLNQETFKEIMLPIPDMEVQSRIKHKIIESFNLRKQSKHLLECAKRAVEIAIEADEQTAIDWLERET